MVDKFYRPRAYHFLHNCNCCDMVHPVTPQSSIIRNVTYKHVGYIATIWSLHGHGGSVVASVPCVRKVASSNPTPATT